MPDNPAALHPGPSTRSTVPELEDPGAAPPVVAPDGEEADGTDPPPNERLQAPATSTTPRTLRHPTTAGLDMGRPYRGAVTEIEPAPGDGATNGA